MAVKKIRKNTKEELPRSEDAKVNVLPLRFSIYVIGALFLVFGVVLNTRCDMGVSTVNCIPFVFSEASGITLGQGCMLLYIIDVIIQIIVFRKLTLRIALQIPFSFVMGLLVDMFDYCISSGILWFFQNPDMLMGSIMLILGIMFTGVGVSMVMSMNFVPNPPDGFTQALCKITGLPFGRGKWLNDALRLIIAIALALIMLGHIIGVGIGTVLCVFTIGNICQFMDDHVGFLYRKAYNPLGIVD